MLKDNEAFADQHPQVPWRSMKGMREWHLHKPKKAVIPALSRDPCRMFQRRPATHGLRVKPAMTTSGVIHVCARHRGLSKCHSGMRNRIAHGYFEINLETVWETIQTALPRLIEQLPAIRDSVR